MHNISMETSMAMIQQQIYQENQYYNKNHNMFNPIDYFVFVFNSFDIKQQLKEDTIEQDQPLEFQVKFDDDKFMSKKEQNIQSKMQNISIMNKKQIKYVNNLCLKCGIEKNKTNEYEICERCGHKSYFIVQVDQVTKLKVDKGKYSYKRINHLVEWLNFLQAKENITIEQETYDLIISELQKQRIQTMVDVTYVKMKQILKELKLSQYYEHIPYIIYKITRKEPQTLTRKQEDELKKRFKMIQEPFQRHKPKNRINFLSYQYVLNKLFKQMNIKHFQQYFVQLKNKRKITDQEDLWQLICDDLEWENIN